MQACGIGKAEQIEAAGEEVLANLAGCERKPFGGEFVVHLGGEEVDLRQVGLRGVVALKVEMLRGATAVGVAFHALAGDEANAGLG